MIHMLWLISIRSMLGANLYVTCSEFLWSLPTKITTDAFFRHCYEEYVSSSHIKVKL